MSEFEKKDVNEMDAAEMLAGYREKAAPQERPQSTEGWAAEMIREFDANAKKWHHRQGWEAFGLMCLSALTVVACAAAFVGGLWQPIVAGIAAANLMMAGAWWQKAKAGWSV